MKRSPWRGMTPLRRALEGLCLAMLGAGFLCPVLLWGWIPDQIPGHYSGAGEIDRWTGKWELFLLPVFSVILYLLLTAACAAVRPGVERGAAALGPGVAGGGQAGGAGGICLDRRGHGPVPAPAGAFFGGLYGRGPAPGDWLSRLGNPLRRQGKDAIEVSFHSFQRRE